MGEEITTWHIREKGRVNYNYTVATSELLAWASLLKNDQYFADKPKDLMGFACELDSYIKRKQRDNFTAVQTQWIKKEKVSRDLSDYEYNLLNELIK